MSEHDPVGGDGEQNQHGDEAVGGEEGGVEFAEVIGLDEGVLVEQSDAGDGHAAMARRPRPKLKSIQAKKAKAMTWKTRARRSAPAIPKARGTE